ncbi:ATP-binding cassette domain-containing protein [Streptomyces sp. SID8356]|uniref:ABC transporter ATP-binding protein n=1 Tax=unclassified Streptomyces TaxID=2593676 RepID=UPI00036F3DC2|nr:ABC transporter ATP-binding protein [Streptomyces sp. CcalMP-8W]MYT35954.1 ATP-binding cassette domain-containing protein [Streptomyces sp. SID8356]
MSKTYPFRGRAVDVLSDVDFSVHAGELTAIVGHSGTGKSTLLHILGLLTEPDRGSVVVDGTDTSGLGDGPLADLRRAKMGFVFQSYNLLPQHSALRNTLIPSVRRGKEAQDRARELLERVGLGERVDHLPAQLSGGEQQRVALARALVNDPPVILADEPTGNLDSESEQRLLEQLLELAREGRAVVVVTHNQAVSDAADRVYRMADGRVSSPRLRKEGSR